MALEDSITAELSLGLVWIKDAQDHGEDYQREEIRDSLLAAADENGYISLEKAPEWLKGTKLGFMGSHGHPEFPVRIVRLSYFGETDDDGQALSLSRDLDWGEYTSLDKKKSITAKVSYTLE